MTSTGKSDPWLMEGRTVTGINSSEVMLMRRQRGAHETGQKRRAPGRGGTTAPARAHSRGRPPERGREGNGPGRECLGGK